MYRIFLIIIGVLFSANISYAETAEKPQKSVNTSIKQLEAVVSQTSFFNEEPAVFLPQCNNPRLFEKVLSGIEKYYQENPKTSIVERRQQLLLLKRLEGFKAVDISSFKPETNYAVADRLIDIKINQGLKAEDMTLCQSMGEKDIYLLVYPQNNLYTVEIINFLGVPASKKFTVVYD